MEVMEVVAAILFYGEAKTTGRLFTLNMPDIFMPEMVKVAV
jgi:hypothetical protein